jgi:hypothetical protein
MIRLISARIGCAVFALILAGLPSTLSAAQPPHVDDLRIQQKGEATYFHVRFALPADLLRVRLKPGPYSEIQRRNLVRLPQLVPQDGWAWAVYPRVEIPHYRPVVGFDADTRPSVPVKALEFVGKVQSGVRAKFLLLYPTGKRAAAPGTPFAQVREQTTWTEIPIELDFSQSSGPAFPDCTGHPSSAEDDLEAWWAEGQAARLAVLEALAPDFGFYGFACAATGRKYGVRDPSLIGDEQIKRETIDRELYEATTGAAAITESLQLHRMLQGGTHDKGRRTIDVWDLPGIDIAEHPWEKMMAGKKPSPEPLAQLVPFDNYYVHCKDIRKFIEFGEFLNQWGTTAIRAYEMTSRDYNLQERYERQLCLKSTWLGKTLGPAVIRSLAVTGSDPYLREGSDVTVIFHVANRPLFLAAVASLLQDARREFGKELREGKVDYHGVAIESVVTPLREVSLYRAVVGEFVIYANSPTGLRRVLDVHQGRLKALADSLDFRYMRTIYRLGDKEEDGFAFLSDGFIRQLVGPASKIKEKRRLEALTSLAMVTHGALFAAWENGKLPANHADLLAASALKPQEIYTPEGKGVTWDGTRHAAVSDVYNTLHFATPLIELPIDKVSPDEDREYRRFREGYLNLWRRYFDPVGMRFALTDKEVRVEVYILPLIHASQYDSLRLQAGEGTVALDPTAFSPHTLVQWMTHVAPNYRASGMGSWVMIRLDDSAEIRGALEFWVRKQMSEGETGEYWEESKAAAQATFPLPLTFGIAVADRKQFVEQLKYLQRFLEDYAPFTVEPVKPAYKGVTIKRLRFKKESQAAEWFGAPLHPMYDAFIDDVWYISLQQAPLQELIDRSVAGREGKKSTGKGETVPINSSVHAAPGAAVKAGPALRFYLNWESQRRALANDPIWYALYRGGLIRDTDPEPKRQAAAQRYLGFVPVSPDGAAYMFATRTGEVVNQRHGSLRRPLLHEGIEAASPLGQLLDHLRTVRADLRFREDGVQTTVTIERKLPAR